MSDIIDTLEKLGITKSYDDDKLTKTWKVGNLPIRYTEATEGYIEYLTDVNFDSTSAYGLAGLIESCEQKVYLIEQLLGTISKLQHRFTEQHNEHLKEMIACNERYVNLTKYYKETHNV